MSKLYKFSDINYSSKEAFVYVGSDCFYFRFDGAQKPNFEHVIAYLVRKGRKDSLIRLEQSLIRMVRTSQYDRIV